jgi:hypothetical protein
MKTTLTSAAFFACMIFLGGCTKQEPLIEPPLPIPAPVQNLVGMGNRVWHLFELYDGGVQQALTNVQKSYTKTYTIDPNGGNSGRFTSADGYGGTWVFDEPADLREKVNLTSGVFSVRYSVLRIRKDTLDIENTNITTNRTVREVYVGY